MNSPIGFQMIKELAQQTVLAETDADKQAVNELRGIVGRIRAIFQADTDHHTTDDEQATYLAARLAEDCSGQ